LAKANKKTFGSWAFLIGFVLALIFGVIGVAQVIAWVLVALGLVVGFLNIADDETHQFLMSGAVLVIVSYMGSQAMAIMPIFANVLMAMMLLFIPATVIVAIKSVFALAKN